MRLLKYKKLKPLSEGMEKEVLKYKKKEEEIKIRKEKYRKEIVLPFSHRKKILLD